jgi:hypothetical protein
MSGPKSSSGRSLVWLLFVLMFLVHQDFWWWDDSSLVLGFLPVGLAFHGLFSIGCSLLGWLAITKAWPTELEAFADDKEENLPTEN